MIRLCGSGYLLGLYNAETIYIGINVYGMYKLYTGNENEAGCVKE